MNLLRAPLLQMTAAQTVHYLDALIEDVGLGRRVGIVTACMEAGYGTKPVGIAALERRWYDSLERHDPDYGVYDSPMYLVEAFGCWWNYSRPYLRNAMRSKSLPPTSVLGLFRDAHTIVDLGNGLGFTTAALKLLFPKADVIGTNVPGSMQYRIASRLSEIYGFRMIDGPLSLDVQADLVWATEYFEHFESPLEHLRTVVNAIEPKNWLIANTFTGDAVGHFDTYEVDGELVDCMKMNRRFAADMRDHGYTSVKTALWNNTPAFWRAS